MDRRAIALATKVVPAVKACSASHESAAALLDDPDFLTPPAEAAELRMGDEVFEFRSTVATPHARDNLAHGKIFRAGSNWRTKPAVILVHGWNAELHYLLGFPRLARGLNLRGMNALMFELPYHLQRRPKEPGEMRDFICADLAGMLLATRQAIADIEALLLWARREGAEETAVWGFSLGAWLAGLHLSHSATATAAVLTTPISDLAVAVRTLPFCFPIRTALGGAPVNLERLNLTSHLPRIDPANILVTEALYDLFAPSHTYPPLAQKWKLPAWQKTRQSHISILFSRRCMNNTMDWLRARLHSSVRA
jgi:hypothetical protein